MKTNLFAHRAPTPSGGRSNPDLTSATVGQRKRGYVWRTERPSGRKPRNPDTRRPYRACPAKAGRRMPIEDVRASWRS